MRTECVSFRGKCIMFLCVLLLMGYSNSAGCEESMGKYISFIYLHHSTGNGIWRGGVLPWFIQYNADNGTNYRIIERAFPSGKSYKWENYPFDFRNIWVKNAGYKPYMEEPTLETLTQLFDVIEGRGDSSLITGK